MANRSTHSFLLVVFFLLLALGVDATWSQVAVSEEEDRMEKYTSSSCTACTALGSLFLIVVYELVMFQGVKLIDEAKQVLVEIYAPGYVGGLVLPAIGSIPTAIVILTSALSGSKSTAQDQMAIGMGSIAGTSVMLLTLLWGSCIIAEPGLRVDLETSYTARIMVMSAAPLLIIQMPLVLHKSTGIRAIILASIIISASLYILYGLYQVYFPWIQNRRLAFMSHNNVLSLNISDVRALGKLLTDDGEPNKPALQKLFKAIDHNSDGLLSPLELRALILGVQYGEIDVDVSDALKQHLKDCGALEKNSNINEDEFIEIMSTWLSNARHSLLNLRRVGLRVSAAIKFKHLHLRKEYVPSPSGVDEAVGSQTNNTRMHALNRPSDEIAIKIKDVYSITLQMVTKLVVGMLLIVAPTYPLVDVMDKFSSVSSIPSYYVAFVTLPFVNFRWIWSATPLARHKKARMTSLTLSEIYGAVTLNNIFSTLVFLVLVYIRDLKWNFSSEALSALLVSIAIGLLASFRTKFPTWTCMIAFTLYPISIALVYIMQYVIGLS